MPTFAYSGRTRAGQNVTGERAADTVDAAVAALRRDQILVTRINPVKERAAKKVVGAGRGKSVPAKNLAVFTRQFSVMIDAGLPLVQCLEILGTQEENKNFSAVILPTRIVIALSDGLVRFGPFLLVGIGAGIWGLKAYYQTPRGRHAIDGLILKMPVFGVLMRKIAVARFCRTLSTLLASGVAILEALDITARTAGNAIVEEAILTTRKSIERGETIAQPLRDTKVFPPMVVQMIGVGEVTGALDTMLAKIADFYEEEVDVAVAGLLTLLEPLMIAFLGGIVGGIVIAMYLPIFGLISKLTG